MRFNKYSVSLTKSATAWGVALSVAAGVLPMGSAHAGMDVQLTGLAANPSYTARFDCEGDGLRAMPFQAGTLPGVGVIKKSSCSLSPGFFIFNREFHMQAVKGSSVLSEALFKVNTVTGGISGNAVIDQTAKFFSQNGNKSILNYGLTHASQPITNQAYAYVGSEQSGWIGDIVRKYPSAKFADLVLPGSHDAGMYQMQVSDTAAAVGQMCKSNPAFEKICAFGGIVGSQLLENVSVTQKDNSEVQMRSGTRFFDFRPAYAKTDRHKTAYHIHSFIPGATFDNFLQGVDRFLKANPTEIAVVQIKSSGIDENQFHYLSRSEVESYLKRNISASVGYNLVTNLVPLHDMSLQSLSQSSQRLIVNYDQSNVNSSYSDEAYSASLTDPSAVISQLNATVSKTGTFEYTDLQLQNTGSAALKHYVGAIIANLPSWGNNLVLSGRGNILQATKGLFDRATYAWLQKPDVMAKIRQQTVPIVLLNDFVEVGLSSHAIALTEMRAQARRAGM